MEGKRQAASTGTGQQTVLRKLSSWVEGFYEYTEPLPSPTLFRKWAAISTVAGALERKVWVRSLGSNLYPNLYTILVAPPGVGKTVLTSQVFKFWSELDHHHLASSSVSRASLMDDLRDAHRRLILPDQVPSIISFNSLLIAQNELGVLLPTYENDFMNTLTDLYDGHPYSERKRGKELQYRIDAPHLHILAATTPAYLHNIMPEGAWDQGFASRLLMIYSGEVQLRELFDEPETQTKLSDDLVHDLRIIGDLYGKMTFEPDAAAAISAWHMKKGPPQPDHPRLIHYNTRRTAHLLKLCMVACAASTNTLVITLAHYQTALDWLLEAESFMGEIFKSSGLAGDGRIIEETWHFCYRLYVKNQEPIAEHRVVGFLQERVPAHNVARVLEVMIRSRLLEEKITSHGKGLVPKGKRS